MAVYDSFSQREKKRIGEDVATWIYDDVPRKLRNQIIHVWDDYFGFAGVDDGFGGRDNPCWICLRRRFAQTCGELEIGVGEASDRDAVVVHFTSAKSTSEVLDMLDEAAGVMYEMNTVPDREEVFHGAPSLDESIDDLNQRLQQSRLGYQIMNGAPPQLIRRENGHLFQHVTIPAFRLLEEHAFLGADEEYRSAHHHYVAGRYKECLNDSLKAFESTLKTICERRGWPYSAGAAAAALINVCLSQGLLPSFMEAQLNAIRCALQSGVPAIRNKLGGHGQGAQPIQVPATYAQYSLHTTATNIIFLVQAFNALPPVK